MNRRFFALLAAAAVFSLAGAAADPRHSFAVHFVPDKTVSVSGVVTVFRIIHLDETKHPPADTPHSKSGHSRRCG